MSQQLLLEARALITQKRYDEARALLEAIDHPKAREWLAKLDTLSPKNTTASASSKPKPKSAQSEDKSFLLALQRYFSDEQSPAMVEKVYSRVQQVLTANEEILYIAIQHDPMGINLSPDCIVITTKRFVHYKPKMLGGAEMDDYIWRDLRDVRIKEGMLRATLTFETVNADITTIDNIPKAQGRKVYRIAQEMEEQMREERRLREMEEKRAGASGVYFQSPPPPYSPTTSSPANLSQEDPVQKLKQLKDMLDAGLISQTEYENKKAEILSRL